MTRDDSDLFVEWVVELVDLTFRFLLRLIGPDPAIRTGLLRVEVGILSIFARMASWSHARQRALYFADVARGVAAYAALSSAGAVLVSELPGFYLDGLGFCVEPIQHAHDRADEELVQREISRALWGLRPLVQMLVTSWLRPIGSPRSAASS